MFQIEICVGKAVAFCQDPREETEHFVAMSKFAELENIELFLVYKVQHIYCFVTQV